MERNTFLWIAALLILVGVSAIILDTTDFTPLRSYFGDGACGGVYQPGSGNFDITGNVTCLNEVFTVNGNITVKAGGNLTVLNSTISIDPDAGQNLFVTVTSAAKGMTLRGSTIKSADGQQYLFKVSGRFVSFNSVIGDLGRQGAGPIEGLMLQTNNIILKDTTIKDSEAGIILNADGIIIDNAVLQNFEYEAIRVVNGNNALIRSCTITQTTTADVFVTSGSQSDTVELRGCSFNSSRISVDSSTSKVNVSWFTDVYVNDSSGNPVSNAFVNVTNDDNVTIFTGYTDANGYLRGKWVTEKSVLSSSTIVLNPYLYTATKAGYPQGNWLATVVTNRMIVLQLGETGGGDY